MQISNYKRDEMTEEAFPPGGTYLLFIVVIVVRISPGLPAIVSRYPADTRHMQYISRFAISLNSFNSTRAVSAIKL